MMRIGEPDWRLLSKLKPLAINRLCRGILEDLSSALSATDLTDHERYLKAYSVIYEQDKKIAQIFDGLTRSNALSRLVGMKEHGLITAEEFEHFSTEARTHVTKSLA